MNASLQISRKKETVTYNLEKEFDKREKDVDLWRDKAFKELHELSPVVFNAVRSEINETIEKVKTKK